MVRRIKEHINDNVNLTDEEIQKILSKLLNGCKDMVLQLVIRTIIFGSTQDIDWQNVWDIITAYMPELTQYKDFHSILSAIK